jgi:hypothetical protein
MRQPPEAAKDDQEQPIAARAVRHHRPFQVPAAPLQIVKGRFDAHCAGLRAHPLPSRGPVGDEDPGLLSLGLPGGTDRGRQWALLPELDRAVPVACALRDQVTARDPAACPVPTRGRAGVRRRQAEHGMPAALLTQVHQPMPHQPAIGQPRAVGGSQMGDDAVQQRADHVPLALLPLLLHRQDLPADWHEAGMEQQPAIPHGRTVVQRRCIQHEDQAALAPAGEELAQPVRPQRKYGDLLVRQKTGEAAFAARRLGRADAAQGLRDPGQPRAPSQHDA